MVVYQRFFIQNLSQLLPLDSILPNSTQLKLHLLDASPSEKPYGLY